MDIANKEDSSEVIIKCEVCNCNPFKYKCPRCELHTCSLKCVKIHKTELECNGIRDSVSFVPLSKFNNLHLLSDYRFLEGVDRVINNCRRDPHRWHTRYNNPLPPHLYKLKTAAHKRGTSLLYLPQHFTRHQNNKSILDYSTQEITWKVDFIFPQGEMVKISMMVNEKTKLASAIAKYLDPVDCPDKYKNFLKFYHSAGISEVEALLKAERTKDQKSVYVLDFSLDLKTNLINRTIIENPMILVVKKAFKDEYTVLEDDDNYENQQYEGKKESFFGDFTPVTFFDDLHKRPPKVCKGQEALNSIKESASHLRGRPLTNNESDDDEDYDTIVEPKRTKLNIPAYDQL